MSIRTFCIAIAAASLAAFGAAAQTPSDQAPPAASAGPSGVVDTASTGYVLGRDDVVVVGLLGRNDYGGRARVQTDGTIQLPMIGKVPAAEHTTAELSETIRAALQKGGFFSDPVVTVEVSGYASRYITVIGAVGNQGLIPMNRPYRISEILARVGGVKETGADYVLIISASGEEKKVGLTEMALGGPDKDPFVKAGDKVYAPPAQTFYIYGKVNSPGELPIRPDMTLRMAIAKAGGLQETGSDKKVDLTRGGKKAKISLDDKIQPGDVLVVGERLF